MVERIRTLVGWGVLLLAGLLFGWADGGQLPWLGLLTLSLHMLARVALQALTMLVFAFGAATTRPASPHASREPLQLGAEIYGHSGLEADLEIAELALLGLEGSGLGQGLVMDLADVRLVDGVLEGLGAQLDKTGREAVVAALVAKDVAVLR